jgi:hypothetical protein
MSTDRISLEVIADRPVVRNDQISDIDIAIDLVTTKTIKKLFFEDINL